MTPFNIILTALGIVKSLLQWWREKSIADVAVMAERARLAEAERAANDKMDEIHSVDAVDELRRGGF